MIRIIIFLILAIIMAVLSIPFALIAKHNKETDLTKPVHPLPQWVVNHCIKWELAICGVKAETTGKENILDGPALYVGNHQGLADTMLILTELGPLKSVMIKKEADSIPIVRAWMDSFDCIFMDRSNPREGLKAINRAAELLQGGRSVIIFPEGTRSRGPEMGEFKSGAFKCAIKAGVPVVPFVIDDSYQRYDIDHRVHPGTVKFAILPAVSTEGKKTQELSDEVKGLIQAKLDEFRKG